MNWLIWRQHRKQWFVLLSLLIIFAAIVIPSGLSFWHDYQHFSAACGQATSCSPNDLRDAIFNTQLDGLIVNAVKLSLLALPFILGLFCGVPLLAKEYADKTNKLVWTQGISRKKWLTTKLAWILVVTSIYTGAFSVIATWFSKTGNLLNHDRFNVLAFNSQNMVPVAIAVFGVSIGVLFGAWFKKVLPALGATIGLLLVLQIVIPVFARTHYKSPKLYTTPSLMSESDGDPFDHPIPNESNAWVIKDNMVDSNGHVFEWLNPPSACKVSDPANEKQKKDGERHAVIGRNNIFIDINCLNMHGYHWEVTYQPGSRYWNFQIIESGLYLVLAAIALGGAYALVLKRDA